MPKISMITLFLLIAVAIAGGTAWYMVGHGMSSDLSVIGEGKPVVVLVYENHSPNSMQAFDRLRAVRGDFEGQLAFRMAPVGTPEGEAFMQRFDTPQGAVVVFDGRGVLLDRWPVPYEEEVLRERLARAAEAE